MEQKQLTEEQKAKLKKLHKSFILKAAFSGAKFGVTICLANVVITAIDVFYVHNQSFAFVSSVVSAFLIFRSFRVETLKEHDRIKEETKKILES